LKNEKIIRKSTQDRKPKSTAASRKNPLQNRSQESLSAAEAAMSHTGESTEESGLAQQKTGKTAEKAAKKAEKKAAKKALKQAVQKKDTEFSDPLEPLSETILSEPPISEIISAQEPKSLIETHKEDDGDTSLSLNRPDGIEHESNTREAEKTEAKDKHQEKETQKAASDSLVGPTLGGLTQEEVEKLFEEEIKKH
jgi:hypothetical protein